MQTFAERLISLREDKGWEKKELAEKLHVSDSMISQYESGRCIVATIYAPIISRQSCDNFRNTYTNFF